jgi:hypothetical protein
MKRLVFTLVVLGFGAGLVTGCEPKECKEFKQSVCDSCGKGSAACNAVNKRWGRDEKKCKQGVSHLKARAKTEEGRKLLCAVLNDDVKKQ